MREAMHPPAAVTGRQLAVALSRLGQQLLAVAECDDRVEHRVVPLDLRQVGGHHVNARHLAPVDEAREPERRVGDETCLLFSRVAHATSLRFITGLPGSSRDSPDNIRPWLVPLLPARQPAHGRSGMRRLPMPRTTNPTTKATTVKPITLRMFSLAIARTGSSQNGWIMLATASPLATDIEILPR